MTWFHQKYQCECSNNHNGVYNNKKDFINHCFNGHSDWCHLLLGTFLNNLYRETNDNDNEGRGVARGSGNR